MTTKSNTTINYHGAIVLINFIFVVAVLTRTEDIGWKIFSGIIGFIDFIYILGGIGR